MTVAGYVVPSGLESVGTLFLLLSGLSFGGAAVAPNRWIARFQAFGMGVVPFALLLGATYALVRVNSEDRYFAPQSQTYWEWGGMSRVPLIAAFAVVVIALAALVLGHRRSRSVRTLRLGYLSAATASWLLLVGLVAISIGH